MISSVVSREDRMDLIFLEWKLAEEILLLRCWREGWGYSITICIELYLFLWGDIERIISDERNSFGLGSIFIFFILIFYLGCFLGRCYFSMNFWHGLY